MKSIILALSTLACLASGVVYAESLKIKTGLWETTATQTNPMTGQPKTITQQHCVEESQVDPVAMMEGAENCRIIDKAVKGDTLTFSMECSMEGNKAVIDGRYQSSGDTANSRIEMRFDGGGQTFTMTTTSTGKRVGDC